MLVPHRKTPNRGRELRQRAVAMARDRLGPGLLCKRCGATYGSFADKCQADLEEACPGANAITLQVQLAEREIGPR